MAGDVDREERGGHVQGVYGRSLATGVSEVLAMYRTAVIDAEHEVIATQRPMVSTVARHLDRVRIHGPDVSCQLSASLPFHFAWQTLQRAEKTELVLHLQPSPRFDSPPPPFSFQWCCQLSTPWCSAWCPRVSGREGC